MGDPTLRNDVVAPVASVVATKSGYDCIISWSASTETNAVGYNLYMKNDTNTIYTKINNTPIAGTTYTDYCLLYKGVYSYMVRTVKLENNFSGSYYNMSEGMSDTAYNSSTIKTYASFLSSVNGNTLNLMNTSVNGTSSYWNFGNGVTSTVASPAVTFSANGIYSIMLVSTNGCHSDSVWESVNITEVGLSDLLATDQMGFYPSPSAGSIHVYSNNGEALNATIYDLAGREVFFAVNLQDGETLHLDGLPSGVYLVKLKSGNRETQRKLLLE
jgi:hypothetical protein